jgi:hypothetical protein
LQLSLSFSFADATRAGNAESLSVLRVHGNKREAVSEEAAGHWVGFSRPCPYSENPHQKIQVIKEIVEELFRGFGVLVSRPAEYCLQIG